MALVDRDAPNLIGQTEDDQVRLLQKRLRRESPEGDSGAASVRHDPLRVVIGVDGSDAGHYALEVAKRLGFASPVHYLLVNVTESLIPIGTFPYSRHDRHVEAEVRDSKLRGIAALERAAGEIGRAGTAVQRIQAAGEPAHVLMQVADEHNAALIAVGHNRRGLLDDLMFGSVARTLLRECPCHLLVARPPIEWSAYFNIVLASDDSRDSERGIDALLRLDPKGVDRVYVLAVNELTAGTTALLVQGLPNLKHKAEQWVSEGLARDGQALCERLREAGFLARPLVEEDSNPATAIARVAGRNHASLVVVAARRHGMWDRLIDGSVSEEMLSDGSGSLLVLRP